MPPPYNDTVFLIIHVMFMYLHFSYFFFLEMFNMVGTYPFRNFVSINSTKWLKWFARDTV
jgi:hypothetical protein